QPARGGGRGGGGDRSLPRRRGGGGRGRVRRAGPRRRRRGTRFRLNPSRAAGYPPSTGGHVAASPKHPTWTVAARTDPGRVRDHNEDAFGLAPELGLACVCDGMGGHACGEVASGMAVALIREGIERHAK